MAEATNTKVVPAPGTITLKDVIRGRKDMPDRIVFHGQGGTGKTSFAAFAPNPLFLLSRGETGLYKLMENGLVPECPSLEIANWKSLMSVLEELRTTTTSRKTLVLDTGDGFYNLAYEHTFNVTYKGDEDKFGKFWAGIKSIAPNEWSKLLMALDAIKIAKNMTIVILCHTEVGKDGSGDEIVRRQVPAMWREVWQLTNDWADMVLYGRRKIEYEKNSKDIFAKTKAKSDGRLYWQTQWDTNADAKNRHNLPPEISLGNSGQEAWNNLQQAILEGRKNAAKGA